MKAHMSISLLLGLVASLTSAEALNQDYTQGRITGGNFWRDTTYLDREDGMTVLESFNTLRMGRADVIQNDLRLLGIFESDHDNFTDGLMGLEDQGSWRYTAGQRLDWSVSTRNLSLFLTDDDFKTGFDKEFGTLVNWSIGHSLLTNGGNIQLDGSEYEITFLRGALLDPMQFRNDATIAGMFEEDGYNGLKTLYLDPSIGLAPGFQFGLAINLQRNSYQNYDDEYDINQKHNVWQNVIVPNIEVRLPNAWLRVDVKNTTTDSAAGIDLGEANHPENYYWQLDAGLLIGTRNLSFQQVNGNWDHFFNPNLGKGQVLINPRLGLQTTDDYTATDLQTSLQVGVLSQLTVGLHHIMQGTDQWTNQWHSLHLNANYSNIPLRTKGPSEVKANEYQWGGVLPNAGEVRILADVGVPNALLPNSKKSSTGYSSYAPAYGLLNGLIYGNAETVSEGVTGFPDISAQLLAGLSERAFATLDYNYFSKSLTISDWNAEWAHTANIGIGTHASNFIFEAGATLVYGKGHDSHTYPDTENENFFSFGPFYLHLISSF